MNSPRVTLPIDLWVDIKFALKIENEESQEGLYRGTAGRWAALIERADKEAE